MVHYTFQITASYFSIASLRAIWIYIREDRFNPANSVEPDEMQHYAAFHLGLH